MNLEPAMIGALTAAIINLVVIFGVDVTEEQTAAIISVVTILMGLYIRSQVTPTRAPRA